jgi:hypothetical protein
VQIDGAKPEGFQEMSVAGMAKHGNGGGYVASSATVAATAYVGPDARVLGGRVEGSARVEGRAVVRGGTVSGRAVVKDYAMVAGGTVTDSAVVSDGAVVWDGQISGGAKIRGSSFIYDSGTRVSGAAQVGGAVWLNGGGHLSGTAQILGDGNGALTASSGIYFRKDGGSADDPDGPGRTAVPAEVTAPRSMAWYGEDVTPVIRTIAVTKNGRMFRFDDRGNLKYDLGGEKYADLRIFDARGRLLKTVRLTEAHNTVNTNIKAASQMLLWKVEADGKVMGQGRIGKLRV